MTNMKVPPSLSKTDFIVFQPILPDWVDSSPKRFSARCVFFASSSFKFAVFLSSVRIDCFSSSSVLSALRSFLSGLVTEESFLVIILSGKPPLAESANDGFLECNAIDCFLECNTIDCFLECNDSSGCYSFSMLSSIAKFSSLSAISSLTYLL